MGFLKKIVQDKQSGFVLLLFVILTASLLHRLGYQPLYLEEPRRALIALEMIYNNNYFVPTEFGEYYYKKPPAWNWVIIGGYKLFGVNEFAVRIFSVISFLIMGLLIYRVCRRYINKQHAIISSLFFLVSVDLYFYFSLLGEIDIFYSLVTFTSFIAIYHYYEAKKFHLLFIFAYILSAIGFLTKGFPSLIFLTLSLLTFFYYKKDLNKLFSWYHATGIMIFLGIVGFYFFLYNQYNDAHHYLSVLWSRSSKRTLIQENILRLIHHIYRFPLKILLDLLPASLMIIFLFQHNVLSKIRKNKLVEFSFFMFTVNVIVYWISPGARDRYIYMLFPLVIVVLAYFYLEYYKSSAKGIKNLYAILNGMAVLILPAASLAIIFIEELQFIKGLYFFAATGFLIGGYLAFKYYQSEQYKKILLVIFSIVIIRFLFNLTVIEHRNAYGEASIQKNNAYNILQHTGFQPVYLYQSTDCSHTTIFYLEKELKLVVSRKEQLEKGRHYIVNDYFDIRERKYEILLEFKDWKDKRSRLIKAL